MSAMAWVNVWQAPLAPMPQQAVASFPFAESTAIVPPLVKPEQQVAFPVSQKSPDTQLVPSVQAARQAFAPQM
jgi:hypothetical protein